MQTIISQLDLAFRSAIQSALNLEADPQLSVSQNDKFGDYQANAAMGLAKKVTETTGEKTNPRAIAEKVKAALSLGDIASEVSIAGPGFINVRLSPPWLATQLSQVVSDNRAGVEAVQNKQTVVVDYSGPNVAKQMHVGHLRSTIIGDAISRVLEFQGHKVIRQNHIGDWGTQFGMLISYLRATNATGDTRIEDLDKFYKEARKKFDSEPAFADEARATVVRFQGGGEEELALWRKIVDESRRHFKPIYDQLAIKLKPTDERGESFYNPKLAATVKDLRAANLAVESEGATVVFTEGSEAPLIVEKTGGGYGYATTDLTAIRYRVSELHANRIIYFVGAPQSQHFKQVFTAAKNAGWAKDVLLEHASFGSVLGEDGKMFKARSGESVKLKDLLDEAVERAYKVVNDKNPDLPEEQKKTIATAVGIGAVKYADLSKDRNSDYVFSWDQMLALDGNTAVYLQYQHARICSIFRKSGGALNLGATILLESPFELSIAKIILRFGEVVELVARELKPHYLCTYLYELATKFSSFFENCPVLQSQSPTRESRLALCAAAAKVLSTGLDLLGIEHPEQM